MKKLCVSAITNRIYDANTSKRDPSLMLDTGRVDRTVEVINAAIQYFRNTDEKDKAKILDLMGLKSWEMK